MTRIIESEDDNAIDYEIGVDTREKETGTPVYFMFKDKDSKLEFWFSCDQAEEMANGLRAILDDIKSGAAYDTHH